MLKIIHGRPLLRFALAVAIATYQMNNAQASGNVMEEEFARANQHFSFQLHRELAKESRENIFSSPFSISTALAMTYLGAKSDTAEEMEKVLGISHIKQFVHKSFHKYLSMFMDGNDEFSLLTANRIFPNNLMEVEDIFLDECTKYYNTDPLALDFSKEDAALKTINDWVSDKTNNKIKNLIGKGVLNSNTLMVLVNAIYFKGNWASQFDPMRTRKDTFFIDQNTEAEVDFMFQKRKFPYGYHPGHLCSILQMPYKGESLAMVIILPDTIDGLAAIEDSMTTDMFRELEDTMRNNSNVEVYIPKFKLETSFELSKVLTNLGMPNAFGPNADFSGMDKTKRTYLSKVLHKAFVEVNEEGTEAAAATAVVMAKRAAVRNPVFRADKPFLFFIKDLQTNIILFSGRFSTPEAGSAARPVDEL